MDWPSILWIVWSIKESVYKLEYRKELKRYFAPKKIEIQSLERLNQSTLKGFVKGLYQSYPFQVSLTEEYVLTHAYDPLINPKQIQLRHFRLDHLAPDQESKACTEKLIEEVEKKIGDPYLKLNKQPFPLIKLADNTELSVSISHHGGWGSIAILLPYTYSSSSS